MHSGDLRPCFRTEGTFSLRRLCRAAAPLPRVLTLGVVLEALAGLAAETAGCDEVLQQGRWGETFLAELVEQRPLDCQGYVESYDVEQLERAHRQAAADLHRGIDVVADRVVRLEHFHRVVEVREQERVDDEACAVSTVDRLLSDRAA